MVRSKLEVRDRVRVGVRVKVTLMVSVRIMGRFMSMKQSPDVVAQDC